MEGQITISLDKSLLDVEVIHNYLNESYWATGRSRAQMEGIIKHSVCVGAYNEGRQVGFARVLTDYHLVAWIYDVFVLPTFQGKGIGKKMMLALLEHPELKNVSKWKLKTRDAHYLYTPLGFKLEPQKFDTLILEKTIN